ncbi:MAG TPA: response regulator [Aquabacterium sp.]|uniref:response regulator transcription factor n=1 Tax=Aquabacterium sp. TaxID=1872578 RepID=UPI002E31FAA1|nr:response regulator [Aquabacterium sp.]HEX5371849.1 response regulator [Aquabacterium sp.]
MDDKGHIHLVDDDPSVRTSLSRMLTYMGYTVDVYEDPQSFLKHSLPVAPAVLISDMRMPGMSGVELQRELLKLERHTPIVFISGESQTQEVIHALKNGAVDFLLKPFNMDDLLQAIHKAMARDRERLQNYREQVDARQRYESLTPREREVCQLVIKGLMNKDIADHFQCSLKTIKVHRARVMEKLGASSLLELVDIMRELEP